MGGLKFKPATSLELGLDAAWTAADAALEPFEILVTDTYNLEARPNQSYDFSLTSTYSDLDVSRLELGFSFRYDVGERFALQGGYRYLDLEDDAPYLYDTSGSIDLYSLGIGWAF